MNNPQLSICIPTYNRAPFLRECLDSIVAQYSNPETARQVEIVLSDNGSTDNTRGVVTEYQQKFPNIHYFRSAENLGVDKNILNVVEEARGEYCWMLGDDDVLFPDALNYILPILSSGRADYIIANCWGYNNAMTAQAVSRPNLSYKRDTAYSTLKDFVKTINNLQNLVGYFGGLSVQIFKKSAWDAAADKEQWVGTQTLHMFVLLNDFKDRLFMVLSKPLVKTRADNMRWDTFPGLERLYQRQLSTYHATLWIIGLYNLPISRLRVTTHFYFSLVKNWSINTVKKYLLSNPKVRAAVVPKLKRFMGK